MCVDQALPQPHHTSEAERSELRGPETANGESRDAKTVRDGGTFLLPLEVAEAGGVGG